MTAEVGPGLLPGQRGARNELLCWGGLGCVAYLHSWRAVSCLVHWGARIPPLNSMLQPPDLLCCFGLLEGGRGGREATSAPAMIQAGHSRPAQTGPSVMCWLVCRTRRLSLGSSFRMLTPHPLSTLLGPVHSHVKAPPLRKAPLCLQLHQQSHEEPEQA